MKRAEVEKMVRDELLEEAEVFDIVLDQVGATVLARGALNALRRNELIDWDTD